MKKINHFPFIGNQSLYLRLLLIAGGIVLLTLIAHWFEFYIPRMEIWIKSLGVLAPIAFILFFTMATPLFMSVDALCVAAGVLFPLNTGSLYVAISTYLAASMIFLLGRYFFRDRVKTLLDKQPKMQQLDSLLANDGLKIMFLLRLIPLPFALLSYALSITQVKFKDYLISTSGILIYNLSLVYFGFTAKHITKSISTTHLDKTINFPLLLFGFFVIVLSLFLIVIKARNLISQIDPIWAENDNNSDKYY